MGMYFSFYSRLMPSIPHESLKKIRPVSILTFCDTDSRLFINVSWKKKQVLIYFYTFEQKHDALEIHYQYKLGYNPAKFQYYNR